MIFTNKSRNNSTNSASSSSIVTNKKKDSHQYCQQDKFSAQKSTVHLGNASMIRLQIQSMGPICKSRRKISSASRISNEGNEDAGDYAHQFAKERWPNHDDDSGMWLSSGSSSPSCCFDDKIFGNLLKLSLDDWLVSVLTFCKNSSSPDFSRATTFFDGSRVNPLEEAYFVLHRASSFREEILEECDLEEEITSWLMHSVEAGNEFGQSGEDCKVCKSNFELTEIWEFQEGILDSLVDLEDCENSEWMSDSKLNFLQIDFPSPSYKSDWSSDISQSLESVLFIDCSGDAELTELPNIESDEPIFWPFDHNFDLSTEFSRNFCIMSPRKM